MSYSSFDARQTSRTPRPLPARILCIQALRPAGTALARRLAAVGYVTAVAHDGAQGLSAILKSRPDAVVCDLHLPILNGRELRNRLLALTPMFSVIPFIFVGNDAEDGTSQSATRHLDGDAHVPGSIDVASLEQVIHRCLTRLVRDAQGAQYRKKPRQIELSDREAECLTWSTLGKTSSEIAVANGSLRRSVEFAIETACRKLKLGLCAQGRVGVV